ncbi:Ctr copper transporter family-domain-containing protein [Cladochytrium replicatum]|nr:Ctr copper transporter family-domain-containing protein [Cladochytrium replicatum]
MLLHAVLVLIFSAALASAQDCLQNPWAPECSSYHLPDSLIDRDLASLCTHMSFMPGCSLRTLCNSDAQLRKKTLCAPMSLLADVCAHDMPGMRGCADYVAVCGPRNSTVKDCATHAAIEKLPTTKEVNEAVRRICTSHAMDECVKCTFRTPTAFADCDLLSVYSELCLSMPDMEECNPWKSLCQANPSLSAYCHPDLPPPVMKMYFHFQPTHVLFDAWVPRSSTHYLLTTLLLFASAFFVEYLQAHRPEWESSLLLKPATSESRPLLQNSEAGKAKTTWSVGVWGLVVGWRFVEVGIAYVLMLAAMSFNVWVVLAVVAGLAVGHAAFLPYRLERRGEKGTVAAEEEEAPANRCC